ncbi:sugar transferase [Enterococcus sp. AZ196]|uniref:sugar transferase n=1 Tax=Enterococcus sp. AZ196 TaxID=2774659 RepID=UPI003D29D02B
MNKWITYIVEGPSVDSVSKARGDVSEIAEEIGFRKLYIYRYIDEQESQQSLLSRIDGITAGVAAGDLIVYQYPSYNQFVFEKTFVERLKQRGARIALLIHDSELLRDSSFLKEIDLFNHADILVTHGEKMELKLKSFGITTAMVSKELFDYRIPAEQVSLDTSLKKALVFAGNVQKSVFLKEWDHQTKIQVFGSKDAFDLGENVEYMGVYSQPDLLRMMPKNRFGIAWDNDLPQGGKYREYTRYNAPHKISLYLAVGVPVIVWRNSAISELILRYKLGYAIDSLEEIDLLMEQLTRDELKQLKLRVNRFSDLLKEGIFTKQALIQVEQELLFMEMETANDR